MKKAASFTIALTFLILYSLTLRPGVLPADSGEFQLAAAQLQIAHPPGFPLYILIGWLFTQLPGPAASNLNLLSLIFSVATLSLFPFIMAQLPHGLLVNEQNKSGDQREWVPAVGGTVAAVLLGTSTTFWSQATTTNIRSLTTLFAALGFLFLLKWLRQTTDNHQPPFTDHRLPATGHRSLVTSVLLTSLGVTHHLSLAFVALVMVIAVLLTHWRVLQNPRLVGRLSLAVLAGLLPWLLLLILEPSLRNGSDFFVYVTGLGFGGDFFFIESAADLLIRLRVMWNVLTFQFHWSAVLLAVAGLVWLTRQRWQMGLLLGGSFILLTLIAATYRAPQTVEYMLPAYLPIAIGFGWLTAAAIIQLLNIKAGSLRNFASLVILVVCLLAGWQTANRLPRTWDSYRWLAQQHDTADYAFNILDNAPPNATVFSAWHWFTPLSYLQTAEGHRPDLNIVFVDPTFNNDWSTAIVDELVANRPVVTTNFDPDTFRISPPLPLGEAFLWPVAVDTASQLASGFDPLDLTLGRTIQVQAADLPVEVAVSETAAVTVGWELLPPTSTQPIPTEGLKMFVHLVGSDGQIYAQADLPAHVQAHGLSLTRFELTPRAGMPLGPAKIMLGAYTADGFQLLDTSGEARTEIGTIEIIGTRWRPITRNPANEFDPATGRTLIGTDVSTDLGWGDGNSRIYRHWRLENGLYWTSVEVDNTTGIVNEYVPLGQGIVWLGHRGDGTVTAGDSLAVTHRFASDRPVLRDIGIAVRQVGYEPDNFTWAWLNSDPDNDIPAAGAIPTLKWIAGSQVDHPRTLAIPENGAAGQTTEGFLRLYDVFTRQPLPILDERVTADGRPWIRYGRTQLAK